MTTISNFQNPNGPFLGDSELAVNIDSYDEELVGQVSTLDIGSKKYKVETRVQDFNKLPSTLSNSEYCEALRKSTFLKKSLDCDEELALKIAAKIIKTPQSTRICKHEAQVSATIMNGSIYLHKNEIVAKGNYKTARKSKCISFNGQEEKVMRLKVSKSFNSNNDIDEAEAEAKLQMSLDHPHIVKVKEYNRYNNIHDQPQLEIFEEICGPTLEKAQLNEREKLQVMIDLASALDYLHGKGLVHNDLKADNVLTLNKRGKLADFGLCRKVGEIPPTRFKPTLAPEYQKYQRGLGPSSTAADVYQFGLLLKSQFKTPTSAIQKLIDDCTQEDPLKRPTMKEVRKSLENAPSN